MSQTQFDPNRLAFARCTELVDQAVQSVRLDTKSRIVTSRDPQVLQLRKTLETSNIPSGFQKWQLPVYLSKPSHLFATIAEPGAKVGSHSHNEGEGIRFIVSGSIIYNGQELTAGDWMFIPAGVPYSFEVGPYGAMMCYCYCCCCV